MSVKKPRLGRYGNGLPTNRFFESRCGLPWNEVFSEFTKVFSYLKTHGHYGLHQTTEWDVAVNTWRGESGKIYNDSPHGTFEVSNPSYFRRCEFYVEPETGILRKTEVKKTPEKRIPLESIAIDTDKEFRKIEGIWYYQEFRNVETTFFNCNNELRTTTKRELFRKKQLNSKELKGLKARYALDG